VYNRKYSYISSVNDDQFNNCIKSVEDLDVLHTGLFQDVRGSWRGYCLLEDWVEQCFASLPTQYRLYGRRFLQVKRPNQQYQSTEGNTLLEVG